MINLYITEEEIEECYQEMYDKLRDVPFPSEFNQAVTVNYEIKSLVISKKIEHQIHHGRIIMPDGEVFQVKDNWVQFN